MVIKKLISLLLILTFTFIIVGCGNTDTTEGDGVVAEETNHAIDLDGYEFVFATGIDIANPIGIQPYFPAEGTSEPGDAILVRYREIEAEYNCTIVEKKVNDWYQKELFAAVATGEKYADTINTLSETAYVVYRADMLETYSGSEFFDLSSGKWGSKLALDLVSFDGVNCYGVQPDLWPISERGSGIYNAVLFNPDVIQYYQQPDPYELQEQGTWDWANFEQIAVNCTEGEGAEKKYGISSQHDDFAISSIYSNNGQMVKKVDDKYVYGYTDTCVIDAINWMQDLMFNKQVIGTSTTDWWGGMKIFSTGRSAFHVGRSFFGLTVPTGTVADEKFPSSMLKNGYGWIPFPYGPNSNKDDWNIIFDCVERFFVVPVGTDDPSISMRIMDDMFKPIEGVDDWKQYYRRYLFFEEKGFNNFMKMIDTAETSYLHIYDGWDGRQYIVNAFTDLMRNAKKSPIQTVESLKDRYQQMIDERLNNIVTE